MEPQTCFPRNDQRELLKAALFNVPEAIQAWNQWKAIADLDALDGGSERLLPLAYCNLRKVIQGDPVLDRCRRAYVFILGRNERLIWQGKEILQTLRSSGIQPILLKGSSLLLSVYPSQGMRMMTDLDFMVHPEQFKQTIRILVKEDFRVLEDEVSSFRGKVPFGTHAIACGRKDIRIDVHWSPVRVSLRESFVQECWDNAQSVKLDGVPVKILSPADQLINVCLHGVRYYKGQSIQWIPDAWMILKKQANEIDWDRIRGLAQEDYLTFPLRKALRFLKRHFNAPVPGHILQEMETYKASKYERYFFLRGTSSPEWRKSIELILPFYPNQIGWEFLNFLMVRYTRKRLASRKGWWVLYQYASFLVYRIRNKQMRKKYVLLAPFLFVWGAFFHCSLKEIVEKPIEGTVRGKLGS